MRETKYWTWHMAAGVVIFVILGLHMVTMHLGGLTGLFVAHPAEESVAPINSQARDAQPLFTGAYILLLGIALYHGLYGLRTILFELTLAPAAEKVINVILLILGVGFFGLGTWAALTAHSAALAAGG
jgi:succinate dehydrogenase / fumarate reductase membrane anchor subunit